MTACFAIVCFMKMNVLEKSIAFCRRLKSDNFCFEKIRFQADFALFHLLYYTIFCPSFQVSNKHFVFSQHAKWHLAQKSMLAFVQDFWVLLAFSRICRQKTGKRHKNLFADLAGQPFDGLSGERWENMALFFWNRTITCRLWENFIQFENYRTFVWFFLQNPL